MSKMDPAGLLPGPEIDSWTATRPLHDIVWAAYALWRSHFMPVAHWLPKIAITWKQTRPPPNNMAEDFHRWSTNLRYCMEWGRSRCSWPITLAQTCHSMRLMAESLVCHWEGWVWGAGGGSSLLAFLWKYTTMCQICLICVMLSIHVSMFVCMYHKFPRNSTSTLYHCISLIFTVEFICFLSTNQGIFPPSSPA